MSDELIDAHRPGRVEVVIGRAADFVGPGVIASAMGELVFGAALAGKKARTMGRPDTPHPSATSPTSAATSCCLGAAMTPTDGCGTFPTRTHAPPAR